MKLGQQVTQELTQPTVPIDPVWDMHPQHIQTITDWLASQDRFDFPWKGSSACSKVDPMNAVGQREKPGLSLNHSIDFHLAHESMEYQLMTWGHSI
jgi:hypothetical protein